MGHHKRSRRPAPQPALQFTASGEPAAQPGVRRFVPELPAALVLILLIVLAYLPALHGGMLWDDAGHMTPPGLGSLDGLRQIWFRPGVTQQYYPLLYTTFWLEYQAWGNSTVAAHLVNLLLHVGVVLMVWRVLVRLAIPGAYLAAALFALHPVQVESVAWISETKNTLSAIFALATVLAYLRFDRERDRRWYAVAALCFLAGLLSKSVIATIPAALLVIFWWQRGRLDLRRDVAPLLPFFLVAVISGLATARYEYWVIGARGADFDLSLLQRALLAGRVVWFYLAALAWPAHLAFFYPRWTIDPGQLTAWIYPVLLLAVLAVLWRIRTWSRAPLALALYFVGTLFPVLGFLNVFPFRYSFVADHFQYLASLGPIVMVTAAGTQLFRRWHRQARLLLPAAGGALVLGCALLSWRQSHLYGEDDVHLYQETLRRNPAAWVAELNLGIAMEGRGDSVGALQDFQAALRQRPDLAELRFKVGDLFYLWKRYPEALAEYRQGVRDEPWFAEGRFNYGAALIATGHDAQAVAQLDTAGLLDPDSRVMQERLSQVYRSIGETERAEVAADRAARLPLGR